MTRRDFVTVLAILGAAGCAAPSADVAETRVAAQGEELVVSAVTDSLDPAFWAIEIRSEGALRGPIVLSSEDEAVEGETAQALAAVRDAFGAELADTATWYGCAVAECSPPSISECVDVIRRAGGCR